MNNIVLCFWMASQHRVTIFFLIPCIINLKIFFNRTLFGYLFLSLKLVNFYGTKLIGQEVGSIDFRKIKRGCFAMLSMPFLNNACLFEFDGLRIYTTWFGFSNNRIFFVTWINNFIFFNLQGFSLLSNFSPHLSLASFKLFHLNFHPLLMGLPPNTFRLFRQWGAQTLQLFRGCTGWYNTVNSKRERKRISSKKRSIANWYNRWKEWWFGN